MRKGRWQDRQIISAHWIEESTRAYSASALGPGYGYLWWIGSIDDGAAPSVKLPEGSFFAFGAGGQYAFVIPAYDLVVIHRAAHLVVGGPSFRDIGRLLWLLFDAGGYGDIGPDASIEAARHGRANGDMPSKTLPGKTILYGYAAAGGPYRTRLNADSSSVVLRGSELAELDTGSWQIAGDHLCRNWQKIQPRRMCLSVTTDGSMVQLFDHRGLMVIHGHLVDN